MLFRFVFSSANSREKASNQIKPGARNRKPKTEPAPRTTARGRPEDTLLIAPIISPCDHPTKKPSGSTIVLFYCKFIGLRISIYVYGSRQKLVWSAELLPLLSGESIGQMYVYIGKVLFISIRRREEIPQGIGVISDSLLLGTLFTQRFNLQLTLNY